VIHALETAGFQAIHAGTGGEGLALFRSRGPDLPDYAVDRVFDRFYSLKNEVTGRKGSGIGLSFVKAAMDLHGGVATLENREGGGAIATLRFDKEIKTARHGSR